jgi:hypothetical protein
MFRSGARVSNKIRAHSPGRRLRVASLRDTLRGKMLACHDSERRASIRRTDLLDIMRLVEAHPRLRKPPPADVAKKIKE